ncbi:hypothetical protein FOMPIDRAFT_120706 [Fomitopsis schrenkii]|uniref:Uncharacterized protein n=1 Tax=Fomitopsis schrenkii TaxID=2126942 RepID=S8FE77_FOMSC|nr:hypothetical protein FOMPIDRAFT_120706 [Fomitopsis schrenkii]
MLSPQGLRVLDVAIRPGSIISHFISSSTQKALRQRTFSPFRSQSKPWCGADTESRRPPSAGRETPETLVRRSGPVR